MKPGGVVLCGGQSRRMGRPKARLSFGPESLLARIVRLLSTVAEPVVVVSAPGQELPGLPARVLVAHDPVPGRGPLQGLAAGLSALPETVELVYATGTDAPFLEPAWVERLVALIGDHDLAIPRIDGFHHPLAALYRRARVLPEVARLLAVDRLSPRFLTEALPTREVSAEEMQAVDPELTTLRNLNTPDDYLAALRRAGLADVPRIRVELHGVPRLRAGADVAEIEGTTVQQALSALAARFPGLAGPVIADGTIRPAYRLVLNGEPLVADLTMPLCMGDTLIVHSADDNR